jgi:hypothetical protein
MRTYVTAASKRSTEDEGSNNENSNGPKKKPSSMQKPPSNAKFQQFKRDIYKVVGRTIDMSQEPCWDIQHGYLYCLCCEERKSWNNRYKHVVSDKHIKQKAADL